MNNNDIVPGFDDEKNDSLKIRLQTIGDIPGGLILYLSGHIDTYNCNWFQRQIARVIEVGFIRLVFNLADYNMVSSVDIGSFCAFLKALKPRGGNLVFVEMQPLVYKCYQLLGFSYFFNIMDTLDEAVDFLKQPGPFPRIFKCTWCSEELKSTKAESIRCPKCYIRYAIDNAGQISVQDPADNNKIVTGFDIEKVDKLKIRLQRVQEVPGCLILWIYGCVGKETHTYFQRQVQKVIETGFVRLIFPFIDYTKYQVPSKEFVSAFVDLSKTVRSKSGDIVLVEDPPTVYDLFLQLGIAQVVHNRKDLGEAVAFFSQ